MNRSSNKLFHVLVVVGASMTGAAAACGGQASGDVDPKAAQDAAADGKGLDAPYATISPDPLHDSGYGNIRTDAYVTIMDNPCPPFAPGMCPPDAGRDASDASDGSDAYPGIRPNGDF